MSLATIVANGIGTIKSVTASLQAAVVHRHVTARNIEGTPTETSTTRSAIVEKKQRLVKTASGQMEMSVATITFLEPVAVALDDTFTLSDGTNGQPLNTSGLFNEDTDLTFLTQVYLG